MKTQLQSSELRNRKVNALPVFVVEDNPAFSFMLTYKLEQEYNFNIHNFDSGEDCLMNIDQHHPAIIILDYKLKKMSGVNVLNYVKLNYPEVYVIVVTEQKNIHTAIDIMRKGAFDYIQKSKTSMDDLRNSIYKVLADMNVNDHKSTN
jgi:DNA-binding NtrC family response regulator